MRTFAVFVHSDEIPASSATVAIKRYAKLHPEVKQEHIKAVNVIAIKTTKTPEKIEIKEQGVVITETPKPMANLKEDWDNLVQKNRVYEPEDMKPASKDVN